MKRALILLTLWLVVFQGPMLGNDKKVLIYAHRGASFVAPENTLAAMREAVRVGGVDFLEMDLHITRDGEIVVIHDDTVDRTTNGKGKVHEMTLAQVQALDAGSWFNKKFSDRAKPQFVGEKIPTLKDVIDFAKSVSLQLYIETKTVRAARKDFERKLEEVLDDKDFDAFVVVQSFDVESLKRIKALNPNLHTALLVERLTEEAIEGAKQIQASEIAPHHESVHRDLVRRAHAAGLKVTVWTVDDPAAMKKMISDGVDGLITNRPEVAKTVVGETQQ